MATVTGITVERATEIENASVISGHITGSNLYLTTQGGSEVNAGQVVPTLPPLVNSWPVGSIYMSTSSANPATALGGGVWARWGQGRVPLSLDSTQAEYNAAEEIGGSETHAITVGEMPSHNHGGTSSGQSANHTHQIRGDNFIGVEEGNSGNFKIVSNATITQSAGSNVDHTHTIPSQGSGTPMSIVQPYIVCYMWKRTA